mgnify:CR=1 FL=1
MAASILTALLTARRPARLMCVGAASPIDVTDRRSLTDALDLLAMVDDREVDRERRRGPAMLGATQLILCSARPGTPRLLTDGGLPAGAVDVAVVDTSGQPPGPDHPPLDPPGGPAVVSVSAPAEDIASEWNDLMSLRRDRAHVSSTGTGP